MAIAFRLAAVCSDIASDTGIVPYTLSRSRDNKENKMQETHVSGRTIAVPAIGVSGIAYCLGECVPIEELSCMADDSALLHRFRKAVFRKFSRSSISMAEQAIRAAQETLRKSGLSARDIDAVVVGSSELNTWAGYPEGLSTAILQGLGINHVLVVGVTLAGCANVGSSLRVARNMIAVDGYRNVLVIETNQHRDDWARLVGTSPDDIPVSVFGDGAVSFIVGTGASDFEVIAMDQIVVTHIEGEGGKHDAIAKNIASCRRVGDRALELAGLTREQIHCVLFGNTNFRMMLGMLSAMGFSGVKFFSENTERYGHVWSADILINLHDFCEKRQPPAGSHFMLVAQGSSYYSAVICRKNF